jgi:hypothetical protein
MLGGRTVKGEVRFKFEMVWLLHTQFRVTLGLANMA